jgi:hypothetical protein
MKKFRIALTMAALLAAFPVSAAAQSVRGVGATAVALDAVLTHLVNNVSTEVKQILQQALEETQGLEATFSTDFANYRGMTVSDIESITGNALNQVDNGLNSSLADLTRLEETVNAQVATQIRDSIHLANISWKNVAKDTEKLMIKFERGAAVIVDTTMIQVIRIIVLVGAFIILVIGVIVLVKKRAPGIVVGAIGLVLIIFCFTPFFSSLVSTWAKTSKVLALDDSVDPPQILIITPASFNFGDKGTLQVLGMNFLPAKGSSKLMVGKDSANAMAVESRASINPASIALPLEIFSGQSGTYYLKLVRDDGKESPVFSLYTQKPEQVPIRISFTVWQTGKMKSDLTALHQVNTWQTDHGWGNTTKTYQSMYTPPVPFATKDFTKNPITDNNLSSLTENITGTSLLINYTLTSGPSWDTWRGWYQADYTVHSSMTDFNANTRQFADHGTATLYYDEETQQVSATKSARVLHLGLISFQARMGGTLTAQGASPASAARLPAFAKSLATNAVPAEELFAPQGSFRAASVAAPAISAPLTGRSAGTYLRAFARPSAAQPSTAPQARTLRLNQNTQITFDLGGAPQVPGFEPAQTWYDVSVSFGDVSQAITSGTGQKSVMDNHGKVIMTFATDSSGKLSMTWMNN